jgi:flagellar basal body L-ring protein FlgH
MSIGRLVRVSFLALAAVAVLGSSHAQAQSKTQPAAPAKSQTATQFYQEYLTAFDKAKKIEDILPFMAAENRKQAEATPKDERDKMFGLIKMLSHSNVKVLKEEHGADGKAILTVEGVDDSKAKGNGKVTIVKEGGAWKIGEESWSSKS